MPRPWNVAFVLVGVILTGCGASDEGTVVPKAPRLTELAPMTGAIHVTWVNEEKACDTIEIERKSGADPFAVVYSVNGAIDNKHDASATQQVDYTYRLRCKKGGATSPSSNELSGRPGT